MLCFGIVFLLPHFVLYFLVTEMQECLFLAVCLTENWYLCSGLFSIGPSVDDQAVSLSDDGTTIIIEPYNQTEPAL